MAKNGKPAPKGNKYAAKPMTVEQKQEFYLSYCQHIAEGKCKDGWFHRDKNNPNLSLTSKTMEKWMREDPTVFLPTHMETAKAQSYALWESRGTEMMLGKKPSQPALYQIFMRNKFGWDKEQIQHINVRTISDDILDAISKK